MFRAILSFSIVGSAFSILMACGSPKGYSHKEQTSDQASVARQHCIVENNESSCFLEIEKNGLSDFYTSRVDYANLTKNPLLSDLNFEFVNLKLDDYASMIQKNKPTTFFYDNTSEKEVNAFAFDNLNAECQTTVAIGGWWKSWGKCVAGTAGGALGGALGGAAAGSVVPGLGTTGGAIAGGIAGGLSGAAASCGSRAKVLYHFGKDVIAKDEALNC